MFFVGFFYNKKIKIEQQSQTHKRSKQTCHILHHQRYEIISLKKNCKKILRVLLYKTILSFYYISLMI